MTVPAVSQTARGRPLIEIETWIFDLDNTLYPASCRLLTQVDARMTRYIADRLELPEAEAYALQKHYFHEHGATLRGLMLRHGIDPHHFLAYVHEIELACVPADPALAAALAMLPGRKLVHTNGPRRHAERLLAHLDIAHAFCGIVDIAVAEFEPKPALPGYRELIRRHDVRPQSALMVEDIARNLVPAAALGMTTAWLRGSTATFAAAGSESDHIHHVIDDLAAFLGEAAALHGRDDRAFRPGSLGREGAAAGAETAR